VYDVETARYSHGCYGMRIGPSEGIGYSRALLPVRQRILFKMAVLTRKAHTTGTPTVSTFINAPQLIPHVRHYSHCLPFRTCQLCLHAELLTTYTAPTTWNSLPADVLTCDSESNFKRLLKGCDHIGHKPYRPQPYRPQQDDIGHSKKTISVTRKINIGHNHIGHKIYGEFIWRHRVDTSLFRV